MIDDVPATNASEVLKTALINAHALERQGRWVIEQQVTNLDDYPALKDRLVAHLHETDVQIDRLRDALARLDAAPSAIKDFGLQMMGSGQTLVQMTGEHRTLKAAIADQGMKGFEIATYLSLVELARVGKDDATRQMMQLSLAEERRMFEWLCQHIPSITAEAVLAAA